MHFQQSYRDSCVSACVVERLRGSDADELALHTEGTTALAFVRRMPRTRSPRDLDDLVFQLRQGHFAIVTVFIERWKPAIADFRLQSVHGAIVGVFHAVVLCGASGQTLQILDPWFGPEGQPIEMDEADFDALWTADAVLFER